MKPVICIQFFIDKIPNHFIPKIKLNISNRSSILATVAQY